MTMRERKTDRDKQRDRQRDRNAFSDLENFHKTLKICRPASFVRDQSPYLSKQIELKADSPQSRFVKESVCPALLRHVRVKKLQNSYSLVCIFQIREVPNLQTDWTRQDTSLVSYSESKFTSELRTLCDFDNFNGK